MLSSRLFDDDPFFAGHREHMRRMDEMFRDPFGLPSNGMLGLTDGRQQLGHRQRQQGNRQMQRYRQGGALAPSGLFEFDMGFGGMFQNMRRMMDEMHNTFEAASQNPSSHMYTQQSFMSYSSIGGGQPQVYQASTSTTQAAGGVRETRKMVRDSQTGMEKVSVGRQIGERSHVIERQRNRRTGDQEENQEYVNIEEDDAQRFNQEWQERTRDAGRGLEYRRRGDRSERRPQKALPTSGMQPSYRDRE